MVMIMIKVDLVGKTQTGSELRPRRVTVCSLEMR